MSNRGKNGKRHYPLPAADTRKCLGTRAQQCKCGGTAMVRNGHLPSLGAPWPDCLADTFPGMRQIWDPCVSGVWRW